nr:hypothetical protein [Escherichia coli]
PGGLCRASVQRQPADAGRGHRQDCQTAGDTAHPYNAVYLRLATPLGSYWADALLGSRLHELKREKDVS